jgi:hypothetical protein
MPRMNILNAIEREAFDSPPVFNSFQRKQYFDFPSKLRRLVRKQERGQEWSHRRPAMKEWPSSRPGRTTLARLQEGRLGRLESEPRWRFPAESRS